MWPCGAPNRRMLKDAFWGIIGLLLFLRPIMTMIILPASSTCHSTCLLNLHPLWYTLNTLILISYQNLIMQEFQTLATKPDTSYMDIQTSRQFLCLWLLQITIFLDNTWLDEGPANRQIFPFHFKFIILWFWRWSFVIENEHINKWLKTLE